MRHSRKPKQLKLVVSLFKYIVVNNYVPKAAQLLENMGKRVDPFEDFYFFACGGFEAKAVIPEHKSSVTTDTLTSDRITPKLKFLRVSQIL